MPSLPLGFASLIACIAGLGGCATYSDSIQTARGDVAAGQSEAAVESLNRVLDVQERYQIPAKLSGNNTLVLLERATILQGLGRYDLAARDMMIADQRLDWLDIAAAKKAKIGKYMFSGTTVRYRAPPYERVLLNTLNMINFLALGDIEDAKVEARRFTLIEQFFADHRAETLRPDVLGFANYLGGVAFEAAEDYQKAARYYTRAWHFGIRRERFRRRLIELVRTTGFSGGGLESKEVQSILEEAKGGEPMSLEAYRDRFVDGELIVLVQTGLAPYKEPVRYPVGRALTIAGGATWGMSLTAEQRERAQKMAAQGLVTWINFPALSDRGLPPKRSVSVRLDQSKVELQPGLDVERQVERAWERIQPNLMVAAVTRMITRTALGAAAGEGVRQATGEDSGLGFLASLFVQGGMAAADKPDTRSWSLLPARIRLRRMDVEPGNHRVSVRVDGKQQSKQVEVSEVGPSLVNFSRYR